MYETYVLDLLHFVRNQNIELSSHTLVNQGIEFLAWLEIGFGTTWRPSRGSHPGAMETGPRLNHVRTPIEEKNQVERTYDWGQTNPIDEVRGAAAKTPSNTLTPRQIKSRLTESYKRKREAKVD